MELRYGQEGERPNSNPPSSEPLFPHRNSPAPGESGSLKYLLSTDAHSIAHAMGERFLSLDCIAFARAFGGEIEPGGVA